MLSLAISTALLVAARGVVLNRCKWVDGKLRTEWKPPVEIKADYYEVQLAATADGPTIAVYSTAQTSAELDFLEPNRSLWVRVRAHKAGTPSLGPGTWNAPGNAIQCNTGANVSPRRGTISQPNTFLLEVMRESEFTYDVDYLMNHNSGDITGDTAFIVQASKDPDQPSFLNTTFRKAVLTLFCVEVLKVHVPDTVTTDGNSQFADYLSCNDNNNATDPQCECDNSIDRYLSKASDQMKYCHNKTTGKACTSGFDFENCQCECTKTSLAYSAKYVGMMPVYANQPELLGYWYSTPKETECGQDETVGEVRSDGSVCTWKRYAEARVIRGGDALDAGWNITGNASKFHPKADPAQVRQNAGIIRKVYGNDLFQKWTCSDAQQVRADASIIV